MWYTAHTVRRIVGCMSATQSLTKGLLEQGPFPPEPMPQASFGETHERYLHYQRLLERVIDVFEDDILANQWLSEPSRALNGQTPFEIARGDDYLLDKLEPLLVRLEHGIYT